jgi:hypothetical protein
MKKTRGKISRVSVPLSKEFAGRLQNQQSKIVNDTWILSELKLRSTYVPLVRSATAWQIYGSIHLQS